MNGTISKYNIKPNYASNLCETFVHRKNDLKNILQLGILNPLIMIGIYIQHTVQIMCRFQIKSKNFQVIPLM